MIKIKFTPSIFKLDFDGHANYCEEEGKDIVCSAVSTLFYTLEFTLEEYKKIMKAQSLRCGDGKEHKYIRCEPKKGYEPHVSLIYYTILTGLKAIAEQYPDNVSIEVIEEDNERLEN